MKFSAVAFIPAFLAVAVLPAQEKKDAALSSTYKVEFRIKDGSGAAGKNGRRYTMLIDTTGHGVFRVGDRVPVATGSTQTGTVNVATQFSYTDIGVDIETRLHDVQGKVAIEATIDLNGYSPSKAGGAVLVSQPTMSQIKIVVNATVTPGSPTLVASIDDPATERKLDVEALVTKVD